MLSVLPAALPDIAFPSPRTYRSQPSHTPRRRRKQRNAEQMFGTSSRALSLRSPPPRLRAVNSHAEQRSDDPAQLVGPSDRRVRRGPEHPAQFVDVSRCTDGQAQAPDPLSPSLTQRTTRVGSAVCAFVAVVVGQ